MPPKLKQCPRCGQEFPTNRRQVYCTAECRHQSRLARGRNLRREAPGKPWPDWGEGLCGYADCPVMDFDRTHPHQKYCSRECRNAAAYSRRKAKALEDPIARRYRGLRKRLIERRMKKLEDDALRRLEELKLNPPPPTQERDLTSWLK